jgi:hypothetical protein
VLALLTKCAGSKWTLGGLGSFVEEIWIGAKRKIGSRVFLEARAQV